MRRASYVLVAFATLALALSPVAADARAGDGGSFGSRGSRSFSAPPSTSTSPYAAPLQRSMTQPATPTPYAPGYAGAPAFGRPSFFGGGGGFMSGLMGGLIGAGIGGMLFGHGMFGGIGGFSGIIGLLLQIAIVVFVVRWLFRRFAGQSVGMPFFAGLGAGNRMPQAMPIGLNTGGGPTAIPGPALSQSDFAAFERNLQAIQAAWSAQNLSALRSLVTPEMLSYFSEQLSEQASRGVRNEVTDVRLLKGDLSEGWVENGRQYATVAMKFSMVDVTRDGGGRIVDGSLTEHVTATEFWTFMRVGGGNWVLSAIQQGR
jgi:predicted lipid-binding transport protein (Tim44 family)